MNEQEEKTEEAAPEKDDLHALIEKRTEGNPDFTQMVEEAVARQDADYWVAEGYDERATVLCELVETFGLPLHMAKRYADEWFRALGQDQVQGR